MAKTGWVIYFVWASGIMVWCAVTGRWAWSEAPLAWLGASLAAYMRMTLTRAT